MTMLLILAGSSAAAQLRQVTAEEALKIHKNTFATAPKVGCASATDREEIVVCGSREKERYRLTVPPAPGQRVAGEAPSALAATKEETCTNIGATRGCPSIDILGIGMMIAKTIVTKVIEAEDE